MIIDLAKFTAKDGCVDETIRYMKLQAEDNKSDAGFVMAHVFQSKSNPNELYMLLGWENQEAVEKHLATEHDAAFIVNMDKNIIGPPEMLDWTQLV